MQRATGQRQATRAGPRTEAGRRSTEDARIIVTARVMVFGWLRVRMPEPLITRLEAPLPLVRTLVIVVLPLPTIVRVFPPKVRAPVWTVRVLAELLVQVWELLSVMAVEIVTAPLLVVP